jgi:hypothetical protein
MVSARYRSNRQMDKSISGRSEGDGRKDTLISGFSDEDIDDFELSGSDLVD